MSKDDITKIRRSIESKRIENLQLLTLYSQAKEKYSYVSSIQRRIINLKRYMQDEIKNNEYEINKLNKKISKTKSKITQFEAPKLKKLMSLNTVKLTALEISYNTATDKLFKVDQKYAALKELLQDKDIESNDLDELINQYQPFIDRFNRINSQLDQIRHWHLSLIDLESQLAFLQGETEKIRSKTEFKKIELNELKTQKHLSNQFLKDCELDLQDNSSIVDFSSTLEENQRVLSELRSINLQLFQEQTVLAKIKFELNETSKSFQNEKTVLLKTLSNFDFHNQSLIDQFETIESKHKTKIKKKEQLATQLLQKIKDLQNSIGKARSQDSSLGQYSQTLEEQWEARQFLLDGYQNEMKRLEKNRVILEHKISVIKDLNEWCPLESKVKTTPGIEEFLFLYDVVYTQNRDMSHDLQILIKEMNEVEKENQFLKQQLAETK